MKLTEINTAKYNTPQRNPRPSFGWTPICRGNVIEKLSNGTQKLLPVQICLLGKEDQALMQEILPKWKQTTKYGVNIIRRYQETMKNEPNANAKKVYHFLMLLPENIPQNSPLKPMCLASIARYHYEYELKFIQTSRDILTQPKKERISGSGQMLIYGICKIINTFKLNYLSIISANNKFYEKIFPTKSKTHILFVLDQQDIKNFMKATQQKYGLNKDRKKLPKAIREELDKNSFVL